MRLEFHPAAVDEASEAADWYTSRRPGLGDEFEDALHGALAQMLRHPESGAPFYNRYRAWFLGKWPFHVVYRLTSEALVIVAVYHTSRSRRELTERLDGQP